MKKEYLVAYSYGTGGIWIYLKARSKREIKEKYPELVIVDHKPDWFDKEQEKLTREKMSFDIDKPTGWLAFYEEELKKEKQNNRY